MKKPGRMTDGELVEAILNVAARARMADAGDVRKSVDVLAELAIEAGARIANRGRDALRDRVSRLEDAAFHFQTCGTCRRQGEDACKSGRVFAAFLRGDELEAPGGGGPAKMITIARIGPPADRNGSIVGPAAIPPGAVPVFAEFDYSEAIGQATVHSDGTAELELAPGYEIDAARATPDGNIGIGFRVLEAHEEGGVRVIDRLELLAVGVSRNLIKGPRS